MTETEGETEASPVTAWQSKPGAIRAVRWDGTAGVLAVLAGWGADPAPGPSDGIIRVWGSRGYATVWPGDYLVRDPEGATRYAPEAFEAAYDRALAPVAALLAQAQEAVAFERGRANRAEALIADALEGVGNFLAQYGTSEIPMFRVGQDLANSIRKTLTSAGPECDGKRDAMSGDRPYRILVAGSRDWDDGEQIAWRLGLALGDRVRGGRRAVIVHGACPTGADAIADRLARDYGYDVEPHPADWGAHGKAAGPIRNREMVAAGADVVLAFILNGSPGATGCADMAEQAGIPVRRFERKTGVPGA